MGKEIKMRKVITGNEAAALAVRYAKPQVISAYPITPQTSIIEQISKWCAEGVMDARFIKAESEHSAMACLVGASLAGARTFTATSSQGLALMHEMLHWASGSRLPIIMVNANRSLGAPWALGNDLTDSLSQRDTGWMQFYCESVQEVFDTVLHAYRVAEELLLPAMVMLDGFYLSHTMEPMDAPDEELVARYLPPYRPKFRLDPDRPCAFGSSSGPEFYYKFKNRLHGDMLGALKVSSRADEEFKALFGREYGLIEGYRLDGADFAFVTMATVSSTAREVVDIMRGEGIKAGLLKIRLFRPFPSDMVSRALAGVKNVAVIDRDISCGVGGIVCQELKAAIYSAALKRRPRIQGFIAGLSGADITPDILRRAADCAIGEEAPEEESVWLDRNG